MASAVTVLKMNNSPVSEHTLLVIRQDSLRKGDSGSILSRTSKRCFAPLKAGLDSLRNSSTVTAPSSSLEA